jgi:hypothetical protein
MSAMDGFTADLWSKLTKAERIEHCRLAAREAEAYARSASPESRQAYKNLAAQWHRLAAEIERETAELSAPR